MIFFKNLSIFQKFRWLKSILVILKIPSIAYMENKIAFCCSNNMYCAENKWLDFLIFANVQMNKPLRSMSISYSQYHTLHILTLSLYWNGWTTVTIKYVWLFPKSQMDILFEWILHSQMCEVYNIFASLQTTKEYK